MNTILNINEAINYMNDKAVLTTNNEDYFTIVDGKVHYKFNGSSISLSTDDFTKLFKDSKFSLVEDNPFTVDDLKDKEYYEKYKK